MEAPRITPRNLYASNAFSRRADPRPQTTPLEGEGDHQATSFSPCQCFRRSTLHQLHTLYTHLSSHGTTKATRFSFTQFTRSESRVLIITSIDNRLLFTRKRNQEISSTGPKESTSTGENNATHQSAGNATSPPKVKSAHQSTGNDTPFRFLDLPPEIRQMVYRWLLRRSMRCHSTNWHSSAWNKEIGWDINPC